MTGLTNGTLYTFQARAVNAEGDALSNEATATPTAPPPPPPPPPPDPNQAPIADAGDDRTVDAGADVTLDGSGSSDPDGDALTYSWTQADTDSEQVTLSDPSAERPTFTAPSPQAGTTLTFTLRVTDSGGLSDTDEVTITLGADPGLPEPPLVLSVAAESSEAFVEGTAPGTIAFILTASEAPAEALTVNYGITQEGAFTTDGDGTLTFPANATTVTQAVTVIDDDIAEPHGSITFRLQTGGGLRGGGAAG